MRVLLVGSKIDVVELVRASIGLRWPHSALTISYSAAEGLNLVETESPDLVVLQTRLDDMDPGPTTTAGQPSEPWGSGCPELRSRPLGVSRNPAAGVRLPGRTNGKAWPRGELVAGPT